MSAKKQLNAPWFFTEFSSAIDSFPVELDIGDASLVHRVVTVVRVRPGEYLVLVNRREKRAYVCEVLSSRPKLLTVRVLSLLERSSQDNVPITAGVALIKGQRWEWLLQKLTELGVRHIVPLMTDRTIVDVKKPEYKKARWEDILTQAAEQSEQIQIPHLAQPIALNEWLTSLSQEKALLKLVASERGGTPVSSVLANSQEFVSGVVFAIGPEGGWTTDELVRFEHTGFHAVHLGDRILRSETAVLYLTSVLQYVFSQHQPEF